MLLSPATGDLASEADQVLDVLGGDPRFKRELPSAQIESLTSPCCTVAELREQLTRSRRELASALDGIVDLAAAGTHPRQPGRSIAADATTPRSRNTAGLFSATSWCMRFRSMWRLATRRPL
jgi:gamma-glutamyl:cysteine ligase YbdK (ATP-grasp superfamily)